MTVTFDFAALHYLNQWLTTERHLHAKFATGSEASQLTAISDAAAHFVIARNFWSQYDTGKGLPRYGPVYDILHRINPIDFHDNTPTAILHVRDQLSAQYGDRDVLSATTKLLWLKVRAPVLIYDSQARIALDAPDGDLPAYYDAWHAKYTETQPDILHACSRLVNVLQYTADPSIATTSYVQSLSSEHWFAQRVLDIYLWHVGRK